MTTVDQLRESALALPEVEEGTHFGMVAFRVRGKGFASVTGSDIMQLQLPDGVVATAITTHPSGERLTRNGRSIGFAVPLSDIDAEQLDVLVRAAWAHRAPHQLTRAAAVGPHRIESDLPATLSKPAQRALIAEGLTTLAQVADRSDAELLALHGVGPKALRMLRDAGESAQR